MDILTGARESPLSQAQFYEVQSLLFDYHPSVRLIPLFVKTTGDIDLTTSLRMLNKTDFFTREIDDMILQGVCRIGIHSAKDLPDPLPKGLTLIALTAGMDSSDSLVLRPGVTLDTLPPGARIGTSSERREDAVRALRSDVGFVDIRGNILQRIAKLESGEVDGVVIAEAALIRLNLTGLDRLRLPGETTLHQGRLAVIAREGDEAMAALFACLDPVLNA